MEAIRWTRHARENLTAREIDRAEAERTLTNPEFVVSGQASRKIFMRRYFDQVLQQEMLLRLVVESTPAGLVVVTAYKTSQFDKYLRGLAS